MEEKNGYSVYYLVCALWLSPTRHSYLKASTGLSFEARQAG